MLLESLDLLGRFGLAEAWTYLRLPHELSDGQRWRLRFAMALHQSRPGDVLVCDEFAAVLDRITARIIASVLRRVINRDCGAAAVVATSHDDLATALAPDIHVHCDFGAVEIRKFNASVPTH